MTFLKNYFKSADISGGMNNLSEATTEKRPEDSLSSRLTIKNCQLTTDYFKIGGRGRRARRGGPRCRECPSRATAASRRTSLCARRVRELSGIEGVRMRRSAQIEELPHLAEFLVTRIEQFPDRLIRQRD
jgi:hypothetical protein